MWAPLNGVGIPLDNYILGLRADHLLHASVYIPCTLFLVDLFPQRRWLAWLLGCCIGLTTEFGQYLLPFRSFDINDLVSNFLGVSLGWLIVRRKVGRASKKI
jgi:glycopeptide antibiotics resistance protein